MKYEQHSLDTRRLPFLFRKDQARKGMRDYTHWHENIEILFFTEGRGDVLANFVSYPVEKNDVFVVNSQDFHMVESDEFVKYYCFIIDSDFCSSNGVNTNELRFRQLIHDNPRLIDCCNKLAEVFDSENDEFKEVKVKHSVLSLLIALLDFIDNEPQKSLPENANLSNVKLAIKYIKDHFSEKLTVEEIAEQAGLSRAYFSRKFKEITTFTLVNYINLVRCQNACKMLRTGKYKINEVAIDCGFENMSYFTRTYKRLMGIAPSSERPDSL